MCMLLYLLLKEDRNMIMCLFVMTTFFSVAGIGTKNLESTNSIWR